MVGWTEEEIKHRNNQLREYASSRQETYMRDRQEYKNQLRIIVLRILNERLTKSEKSALLKRARELEALARVDLGNYNSSDFGRKFLET